MVLRMCTVEVAEWQREAVWWLMASGSALSLIGSGFVLVCYLALARPGRNPLASLVAFLTAADFGWAATNLASLATVLLGARVELFSWSACVVFRGLFQFFAGATVLWTCCISFFLYRVISSPSKRGVEWYEWAGFHAICWGLPLIDALLLALFGHTTLERHQVVGMCYPRGLYYLFSWMVPVACAFTWNLILYVAILIKLRRRVEWTAGSVSRKLGFRFSLYLFVFLLSWAPSLVSGVAELVNHQLHIECHVVTLIAVASFLLTSQGMWNGLVYGLSNRRVREQFACGGGGGGNGGHALKSLLMVVAAPALVLPAFAFFLARVAARCHTGRRAHDDDGDDVEHIVKANKNQNKKTARTTTKRTIAINAPLQHDDPHHAGDHDQRRGAGDEAVAVSLAAVLRVGR